MITATIILLLSAWVRARLRSRQPRKPRMTVAEMDASGLKKWLDAPEKLI